MLLVITLLTLFVIILNGLTTIPFSIGLLTLSAILFRRSWVLFLAFGLGLFLDLSMIRSLGYTSLFLATYVFLIWLYERKFETKTSIFVSLSTFFGSIIYLWLFNGQVIFLQAFANALVTVLLFKFLWLKLGPHSETI